MGNLFFSEKSSTIWSMWSTLKPSKLYSSAIALVYSKKNSQTFYYIYYFQNKQNNKGVWQSRFAKWVTSSPL